MDSGRWNTGTKARGLVRLLAMAAVVPLLGQENTTARFDAASIKLNTSGTLNVDAYSTGNQLRAINVSVLWLVQTAYQMQEFQVTGGPAWAATARFDVVARAEQVAGDQYRPMLRNLLAERFRLAVHRETVEAPIYALSVARTGQLGPKLKPSRFADCAAAERGGQFCGFDTNNRVLHAGAVGMDELASRLSPFVGRTVIDRTGLSGAFDFDLAWTSDARRAPTPRDDGPSIFTALQEQLGLKLDGQRGPVEVLVIDRVEQPTAD